MNTPLNAQGLPQGVSLRADEIAPRDLAQRLKSDPKSVKLIDVRTETEWNTARIDGAVHIPIEQIEQHPEDVDIDGATLVAFLCHHGVRSLRAVNALSALGHKHTRSIVGGIDLWSQAVDSSIPRYTRDRLTGRCTRVS